MTPQQLKALIEQIGPGTQCEVVDLTGTQDHYQAIIISPIFEGKMMIDQHRLVKDHLNAEIQSGEVHALTLKTYTPEQYEKFGKK